MKILDTNPPWKFKTGNLLDPNKVNDNLGYMDNANKDVAQKRYAHSVLVFPFHRDCANGYNNSDSQDVRSYLLPAPNELLIQRMYMDGLLASGSATINIYDNATGLAPDGITNPLFTATTSEQTLFFGQEIRVPAGSVYRLTIEGAAFVTSKLDLIVHLKTDRFNLLGTDTLNVPNIEYYTEYDTLDANTFNSRHSTITTSISENTAKDTALKPMLFVAHDFTSLTDADLLRFDIPRTDSSKGRCNIVRLNCYAALTGTGVTGDEITVRLADNTGVSTGLAQTMDLDGLTFQSASDATPSVDLSSATTGIASDTAQDYRVTFSHAGSTSCTKAYCYLWID